MLSKSQARLTSYFGALLWSLALLALGIHVPGTLSKVLGILPAIIVLAIGIFDRWLWRIEVIRKFSHRPLLDGTWNGELVYLDTHDQSAVNEYKKISIYLVFTQIFSSIEIRLMSKESMSISRSSALEHTDGEFTIFYHYLNTPDLLVRNRSPMHMGSAFIKISDQTPSNLIGEYWTARSTQGTFSARRVSSTRMKSFEEAHNHMEIEAENG